MALMAKNTSASKVVAARSKFDSGTRKKFGAVLAAIRSNGPELEKLPGVIRVRPGFLFQDGWITRQPAVVVVVDPRKSYTRGTGKGEIPTAIGDVAVDVAEASPVDQLIADHGAEEGTRALSSLPASSAPDLALPAWESLEDQSAARGVIPEACSASRPYLTHRPRASRSNRSRER